jgi:uncharacterized protein with GYD domain
MATYVFLVTYTQTGIESVKESPKRLEGAKALLKSLGCELKSFFLLLGRYDVMYIVEAPNDEAIAKAALVLSSSGRIKTETIRAFTEDEYRTLIGGMP